MCLVFKALCYLGSDFTYLTKRFQIVSTQGTHSDQIEMCCGASLGPILYIPYLQPLTSVILKHPVSHMVSSDDNLTWTIVCLLFFVLKSPMSKPG